MWGRFDGGELVAACHVGANLVPVQASADDAAGLRGAGADPRPRRCPRSWGRRTRCARSGTPSPRLGDRRARPAGTSRTWRSPAPPVVAPDPLVRRTTRARHGRALPGMRGDVHRGGRHLPGVRRGRRALPGPGHPAGQPRLVLRPVRRATGWCSRPRWPAPSPYAAQVQGVWVAPDRRGRGPGHRGDGRGRRAGAAREIAPVVSLYVNDWNAAGPPGLREGRVPRDRHASPPSCSDHPGFTR